MKEYLMSLIRPEHYKKTMFLFISAVLLIIVSQVIGTTDNLPGLLALFSGMILIFFSVLHPWRNWKNYAKLAVWAISAIAVTFIFIWVLSLLHKTEYISEGVVMILIGMICLPAIFTGIIGALYWLFRKQGTGQI